MEPKFKAVIGVVILVVAIGGMVYYQKGKDAAIAAPASATPTTQPATTAPADPYANFNMPAVK